MLRAERTAAFTQLGYSIFLGFLPAFSAWLFSWSAIEVLYLCWFEFFFLSIIQALRVRFANGPYHDRVDIPNISMNGVYMSREDFEKKPAAAWNLFWVRMFIAGMYLFFLTMMMVSIFEGSDSGAAGYGAVLGIWWQSGWEFQISLSMIMFSGLMGFILGFWINGDFKRKHPAEEFKIMDKDALSLHLMILGGAPLALALSHVSGVSDTANGFVFALLLGFLRMVIDLLAFYFFKWR